MRCCREPQDAIVATRVRKVLAVLGWLVASAGIFGLGSSIHELSIESLHKALNWHLCAATRLTSEALGGVDERPLFLGTELSASNLQFIGAALDFDNTTMRTVRRSNSLTSEFARRQEAFVKRVAHFTAVLEESGPGYRAYEHRCVFCSVLVGDADNPLSGYPAEGLLPALATEIGASSAQAMYNIRSYTLTRMTGDNLTALAQKVKRATQAMEILDGALRSLLAYTWSRRVPSVDRAEGLRLAVFMVNGTTANVGAVLGWIAFVITLRRARRNPSTVPSGKQHCLAWCCGFINLNLALMLAGSLLVFSVVAGDGCALFDLELGYDGIERNAHTLGLVPQPAAATSPSFVTREAEAAMSIELAQACFSQNGTGDLLDVTGLEEPLGFESELWQAFVTLEDRVAEPPAGRETSNLLEKLETAVAALGGLFVLDPLAKNGSNASSLGILELSANVEGMLMGSTINADDIKIEDGRVTLRGLNSYAALIAGPGKYTFLHGTAGGGFVITADTPTDEELASLPPTVRNALLYARAKEQLIASNSSLSCSTLDDNGLVTPRRCGLGEFRQYIAAEVVRLKVAAEEVSVEATAVSGIFLTDMNVEFLPLLRKVREVRRDLDCRRLWGRVLDFRTSLCSGLAPTAARGATQLLALAFAAGVGALTQYKVWRHLKDNKIIKAENERFSMTLKKFESKMSTLNKGEKKRAQAAYRMSVDVDKAFGNEDVASEEGADDDEAVEGA